MKKVKMNYITVLTAIACIGVVFIHSSKIMNTYQASTSWYLSVIYMTMTLPAVPLFFMLTGSKLLNYHDKYDTRTYFKKRIPLFIAVFLWTIIYLVIYLQKGSIVYESPKQIINLFINAKINHQYWFFVSLLEIYLLIPIIRYLLPYKNAVRGLLLFGIASSSIVPFIKELTGIAIPLPAIGSGYIIYVLLGWYLHNYPTSTTPPPSTIFTRRQRIILYISAVVACIYKIVFTIYKSGVNGETFFPNTTYFYLPTFIMSVAIYVFFRNIDVEKSLCKNILGRLIQELANCSLGIYLTQSIFMRLLNYYNQPPAGVFLLLAPWLLLGVSYIFTKVISCIPYIGNVLVLYQTRFGRNKK